MERRTEKPQEISAVELGTMLAIGTVAVGVVCALEAGHQVKDSLVSLVTKPAAAAKGAQRLWSRVPFIKK